VTPEQRRLDKIARHVSKVRYVVMARMKLRHKLKNPNAWRREPKDMKRLYQMLEEVNLENKRRRQSASLPTEEFTI
jgi:hypothetical protein